MSHIAENCAFPDARIHIHRDDLPVTRSVEALMALPNPRRKEHPDLKQQYLEEFHLRAAS